MSTRCYDTDLNDAAGPGSPRTCRQSGRVGGHARATCAPSLTRSFIFFFFFFFFKKKKKILEQRALHEQARLKPRPLPCPSVVILDSQSVQTTERGGTRGFDGHKRHLLVDTLGMVVARRVEAANVSDRRVGARLLAGLQSDFPWIRTVMADAGYESRKLARELKRRHGWRLHITKRRQRAFKVVGLTWIVERTFAWLARNRRLSKDYELKVETSEAFIDLAAIRLMLKRLARR